MDRIKIPDHSSKTDLLDKAQQDRPAVAAALMVGALSLLGLQGSLVKLTSGEVSLWQTYQHIINI